MPTYNMWQHLPTDVVERILPFAWPTFPCKEELTTAYTDAALLTEHIAAEAEEGISIYNMDGNTAVDNIFLRIMLESKKVSMGWAVDPDTDEEFMYWIKM